MAQKLRVDFVCDLPEPGPDLKKKAAGKGKWGLNVETIRFSYDGVDYEIEVCSRHAAMLCAGTALFVEHARRAGRSVPAHRSSRRPPDRNTGFVQLQPGETAADIRAWAAQAGITVSKMGRVPGWVVLQYRERIKVA